MLRPDFGGKELSSGGAAIGRVKHLRIKTPASPINLGANASPLHSYNPYNPTLP